jgi:hypothetical protein
LLVLPFFFPIINLSEFLKNFVLCADRSSIWNKSISFVHGFFIHPHKSNRLFNYQGFVLSHENHLLGLQPGKKRGFEGLVFVHVLEFIYRRCLVKMSVLSISKRKQKLEIGHVFDGFYFFSYFFISLIAYSSTTAHAF